MANIELLAEITASGMYIFDYFTKVFFGVTIQRICIAKGSM